jgi:two-component system chemotaxis response regulator CheY
MSTRVLIVDDAPFIREVLVQLLTRHDFEVVAEAADGNEAVALALQHRPDLILMDIVMPVKNGIEATVEILAQWPQAVVIAFSTENSEHMVMKTLEAGCRDFFAKPFQPIELVRQLSRYRTSRAAGA